MLSIEFDKFSCALITAALILVHGVWDDIVNLKAQTKIAFQILISGIMIFLTDVQLETFGDLFGISYPLQLGVLSFPITIIAVIGLTNAINMIDGIDGLAAGMMLLAIIGMISFNQTLAISPFSVILLSTAFALLPFLIFNVVLYTKVKVFLGDGEVCF